VSDMRDRIMLWHPTPVPEISRFFDRAFGRFEQPMRAPGGAWMPALDVYETDETFVAKVELPGIEAKDVEVSVEDGTLTVSGKREFASEVNEEHYHRIERHYGSFSRVITLPQTADTEKVDASFDNGVLSIEIPKVEKAKPTKIQVKAT
jgi:HSP20 family protein